MEHMRTSKDLVLRDTKTWFVVYIIILWTAVMQKSGL